MSQLVWAWCWWRISIGVSRALDGHWTEKGTGKPLRYCFRNACGPRAWGIAWIGVARSWVIYFDKERA